ncbi:BgTH12-04939 [Blumeria graminis f. sp. triticale]|uniref:BgTH12-04939 n=1 Tax=Blumeria graminis f. sp. triticale TaxID=1689686 RepID=A0A9W4DLX5_BLUGR|nr:BgTH12-04939 [Blumeria graminis f. sp. triticale]
MTKDLQREVRKEKLRTERLRHQSQSARASRLMVQNCNGYPPLPDNHWNPYFVDPREFMSQFPSNPPTSHGPIYHQVQPSVPPHPSPSNYFPNPHYPQSGNPLYNGFPGPQYYPGRMGVPQYGY